MYVCICNAITEKDLKRNPELKKLLGTKCGKCMSRKKIMTQAEKYIGQFYCYETKTFMKWSELMNFYDGFNSYCSRMWLDNCDENKHPGSKQLTLIEYKWEYHDWLAERYNNNVGFTST